MSPTLHLIFQLTFLFSIHLTNARLSVFVISLGRSGSTILTNVLNGIPGFCVRGENNGVLDGLEQTISSAETGRRLGSINATWHAAWLGAENIDAVAYRRTLVDAFERDVLRCPADAVAVGFKEVRYEHSVQRTLALVNFLAGGDFPNPRLVFNVRNVTAMLASRKVANWAPYPGVRDRLERLQNMFRSFCATNPTKGFLVDYDVYNKDVDQLRGLFQFLGVPFVREDVEKITSKKTGH
jgi:hypothetical protein